MWRAALVSAAKKASRSRRRSPLPCDWLRNARMTSSGVLAPAMPSSGTIA
jgi:hypothetical protein